MSERKQKNRKIFCEYCKEQSSPLNPITRDHVIPRSRRGSNSSDNIIMACRECNRLKGDGEYDDFVSLVSDPVKRQATAYGLSASFEYSRTVQTYLSRNMRRVSLHIFSKSFNPENFGGWLDKTLENIDNPIREDVKSVFITLYPSLMIHGRRAYVRAQKSQPASQKISNKQQEKEKIPHKKNKSRKRVPA